MDDKHRETAPPGRHFGMDWLRIAAFGLLILYHISMVFVPWDFHVKVDRPVAWLEIPMLALNPWRMPLLFLISGFASRHLLMRIGGPGAFAASRARRLLIPLVFGMAVIVPPQPWVQLMRSHGYGQDYWSFWTQDYFRFGSMEGILLPTWNHLWFLAYLIVYTMIAALFLAVFPRNAGRLQRGFDRAFGGPAILILPIAWLLADRALLYPVFGETHALFDDWATHPVYAFAFAFGLALARSGPAFAAIRRYFALSATLAPVAGAAFLIAQAWVDEQSGAAALLALRTLRSVFAWSAIVALVGMADRWWNRDHRWRPMLGEAVFPCYLVHQTIIILVFWWLRPFDLPLGALFVLLVGATAAGCWLFYRIGARIRPLRPLIGLGPARRAQPNGRSIDGGGSENQRGPASVM